MSSDGPVKTCDFSMVFNGFVHKKAAGYCYPAAPDFLLGLSYFFKEQVKTTLCTLEEGSTIIFLRLPVL